MAVLQILIFFKENKGRERRGGTQKTTPSSVKKTKTKTEPGCD